MIDFAKTLAALARFEGCLPHMYLDSASEPNVTVGIGCLLRSVDQAQALPFCYSNALPASQGEVAAEFSACTQCREACPHMRTRALLCCPTLQ